MRQETGNQDSDSSLQPETTVTGQETGSPQRELIVYKGKKAWQYPSGLIKDAANGHIMKPIKKYEITPARSKELHEVWQQQRDAAVLEGLAEASPGKQPAETIKLIVKKRAEVAQSNEERPGNDAARLIFQLAGLLDPRGSAPAAAERLEISMSGSLARDILGAIATARANRE